MPSPDAPARRSLLTRFAFDRDGHLRGWRMIGVAAAAALTLTVGGLVAATLAGAGTPEALPVWITVAFIGIKLPILGLLWWLLGRSEHTGSDESLPDERARLALDRLRRSAEDAENSDDAWDRLDMLIGEAYYVAAHSSDEYSVAARLLAVELEARRARREPTSIS